MGGQWPYLANQKSVLWSRDPLSTNHSSPVLGQLPDKVAPVLALVPEPHAQVDQPDVARLALLQQKVMGDEHPDAESGGEGAVQEGGDGGVLGHVLPALLEALGEAADDVLVVLQQRLEDEVVLQHVLVTQDLGEVIEDVESSDVEFVDCQNGWVAAHNEREIPEELNMKNWPGMTLQLT